MCCLVPFGSRPSGTFTLQTKLKQKIEAVQRRVARYVTDCYENTCSVISILGHLKWETLESRRTESQLTMFFKIYNLVDIFSDQYITAGHSTTRANHSLKFRQIPARTNCFKFRVFFPRTIPTSFALHRCLSGVSPMSPLKQFQCWSD